MIDQQKIRSINSCVISMENSAYGKTGNQEGLHASAEANCLQLAIKNFLARIHEVHQDSRLRFSVCM